MAHVTEMFVAETGSAPMASVERVAAVDGGLRGDRYCAGTGHYSPYDVCAVTLIEREAIDHVTEAFDVSLSAGQHRRNLVTEGVDLQDLLGHRFRIGDATFEGTRPRPPCRHVEQLADQEGVARALGEGRGGICADVTRPGTVAVGDELVDLGSADRTDEIVERLRSEE